MSAYPPGELQWAAQSMPDAMARLEIQNVQSFESTKRSPWVYQDTVMLVEIGMRAFQSLEAPDLAECEHGRLLTDDCDDCERW